MTGELGPRAVRFGNSRNALTDTQLLMITSGGGHVFLDAEGCVNAREGGILLIVR